MWRFLASAAIFCIGVFAVGVSFAEESKRDVIENAEVSISYTSLVGGYLERGKDGSLGPPEARVVFGDNIREEHTLSSRAAGQEFTCSVAWQDVAYFLDGEGQRRGRVGVFGYEGCPFHIKGDLRTVNNIEMREETRIEIVSATGNILWVAPKSSRPLANQNGRLAIGVEMLGNMVWVFENTGISFNTETARYFVEKDGATISFTRQGVVLSGVTKSNKN